MGYLDRYLRNNPRQIISCDDRYQLILKVKQTQPYHIRQAIAESDGSVSLLVKQIIPDVEDWQYGGTINGFYLFKFHNYSHRQQVQAYLTSLGYTTRHGLP